MELSVHNFTVPGTGRAQFPHIAIVPPAFLVIAGPNGAGKSSYLGEVASGKVDIAADGRTCDPRPLLIPQDYRPFLFPYHTAWWNVAVLQLCAASTSAQRRELKYRAIASLTQFLPAVNPTRFAATLSGGEAHTLCLLRTLYTDSDLLLLDEPTAGLDALRVSALRTLVGVLANANKHVIIVTHDLAVFGDSLTPVATAIGVHDEKINLFLGQT